MPNKKKNNNIIKFSSTLSKIDRQIEAILFAASEPLDVETIEKRVNSNTNIDIAHANKIGCVKFFFAIYIKINDIRNPKNKLPLSPKKSLGSLKSEKLKNRKTIIGIDIIFKNIRKFWSGIKKYNIIITEIDEKDRVPSIPSK